MIARTTSLLEVPPDEAARLVAGEHPDPHRILGAHPAGEGSVVRAFHPDAVRAECVLETGQSLAMVKLGEGGLFAALLPDIRPPFRYRIRFQFPGGGIWERDDPYRFLPTVSDLDLYLFNEGTHRRLWRSLGARCRVAQGTEGVAFAVWAPNARRVSVVGDFNGWDGRLFPMRQLGSSGVWELFVPGLGPGALYKYEIKTREGMLRLKADPLASWMEVPPGTASRVFRSEYSWQDQEWLARRADRDPLRSPMSIYEVHLGSWARVPEEGNRFLGYREIAPKLVEHVKRLGFTHIELLPLAEHPFLGSWGYQVSAYYAPTSRYGSPDDLRFLVDYCHQNGIGVLLDWVPAHFPKDDHALRRFDGTALYEHEDPRLGEHPDWGTLIFNYGRNEVKSFLVSNALYWLDEFHFDGLRVDAVASMLYLDYSRAPGEWIPNRYGGRENLEAIAFLQSVNEAVRAEFPGCITVAEESTAWPGVTRAVSQGGLGFTFKWNMGWMHDTLEYFGKDPIHRKYHHDRLTFAMLYEYSERFIMPLSHDEVVHGKRSLLEKMPGDLWQKFANLRLLFAYQYTRPGKQLLFMGSELAPHREWNHDSSLDWHLVQDPMRAGLQTFLADLGRLYGECPCLWRRDHDPDGFSWIDCNDRDNSVISYIRRDGEDYLLVVLNFTPVPRTGYRIGAPESARYVTLLSGDDPRYGGSGFPVKEAPVAEPVPFHGYPQSLSLDLPPLAALILAPEQRKPAGWPPAW
ncbi:1,4-alpha-glucan branching enzyme GlgB [bacterium HR33]|nr:1,4-alpha-glucan branching enzyme GlgB [bacterium HR33]